MLADRKGVQVLTLKLTPEEVSRLENSLMVQEYKVYQNMTLVNDCSSMVARALKENTSVRIPQIIDPSPSMSIMYLNSARFLPGSPVKNFQLVVANNQSKDLNHALQAFYSNYKDADINQRAFALLQSNRAVYDAYLDKSEIQFHDPQAKEKLKNYQNDVQEELNKDDVLNYCIKGSKSSSDAERVAAQSKAKEYFSKQYSNIHSEIMAPNSTVDVMLQNYYKAVSLAQYEKEITGKASFDFMADMKSPRFQADFRDLLNSLK